MSRYRQFAPQAPCTVCGELTTAKSRACTRTAQCRAARAWRGTVTSVAESQPCETCGQLTRSGLGVCHRPGPCRAEYMRRYYRQAAGRPAYQRCQVCGEPTRSAVAVCRRNPECTRARARLRYLDPAYRAAAQAGWRAWAADNKELLRRYRREYLQRPDRKCRRPECTMPAVPGQVFCLEHGRAAGRKRAARNLPQRRQAQAQGKAARKASLAARQDQACTWCLQPLPAGLTGTQVDHIIPVTAGGPDLDWNTELLHAKCNRAKSSTLTSRAIALAAAHDLTLAHPA